MENKKFILVTGGAGFIGSHTVVSLAQQGFEPIIVDDLRNAQPFILKNIETILGRSVLHYNLDCCEKVELKKLFDNYKISGIIHFAAYKAVGESVEKPLNYYYNNLVSLLNIAQLAQEFQVKNIVFSSSCTVYGEPEGQIVVDETFPVRKSESPYGETKIMGEKILADFHFAQPEFKITALRYFNPIGAHESALIGELPIGRPSNLIPFITQTAIGKLQQLTVFGNDYLTKDGTCIRDYIHVVDLADAHVKALETAKNRTVGFLEHINIGTGKGTTVLELIQTFEKVTGEKLNYTFGARRSGDVPAIYANAKKAKEILNWSAKCTLQDALLSAWNWEKYNATL